MPLLSRFSANESAEPEDAIFPETLASLLETEDEEGAGLSTHPPVFMAPSAGVVNPTTGGAVPLQPPTPRPANPEDAAKAEKGRSQEKARANWGYMLHLNTKEMDHIATLPVNSRTPVNRSSGSLTDTSAVSRATGSVPSWSVPVRPRYDLQPGIAYVNDPSKKVDVDKIVQRAIKPLFYPEESDEENEVRDQRSMRTENCEDCYGEGCEHCQYLSPRSRLLTDPACRQRRHEAVMQEKVGASYLDGLQEVHKLKESAKEFNKYVQGVRDRAKTARMPPERREQAKQQPEPLVGASVSRNMVGEPLDRVQESRKQTPKASRGAPRPYAPSHAGSSSLLGGEHEQCPALHSPPQSTILESVSVYARATEDLWQKTPWSGMYSEALQEDHFMHIAEARRQETKAKQKESRVRATRPTSSTERSRRERARRA